MLLAWERKYGLFTMESWWGIESKEFHLQRIQHAIKVFGKNPYNGDGK